MFNNQRPGVYSRVGISGYRASGGKASAALLLPCKGGERPGVYKLESYQDAKGALSGNQLALDCARLLFDGAGRVIVAIAPGIHHAILSAGEVDVRAIVSGFTSTEELIVLREQVEAASETGRECIAFAGLEEPGAAVDAAQAANSGRMVLCCPALALKEESVWDTYEDDAAIDDATTCLTSMEDTGLDDTAQPQAIYGACALAAAVMSAPSPLQNFNGLVAQRLRVAEPLPEDEVQRLIRAGVCVFEQVGARAELIRAVTTHTQTQSGEGSLRSLNTVLIIDDVLACVRGALRGKLSGSGKVSLEGVRDLVAVELRGKHDASIIASFAPPRIRPKPGDPSVALVEISFRVAHLLSQIHLSAYIRV